MEWVAGGLGLVLAGLLVYQQHFYSKLLKELVERLMARDLRDYEQAKHPPPPRVVIKNEPPVEDLNRIMG